MTSNKDDAKALQARKDQALAEKRAAALKANLKRRKEQINARNSNQNDKQDETV